MRISLLSALLILSLAACTETTKPKAAANATIRHWVGYASVGYE